MALAQLRAAAAPDTLARALYASRCDWLNEPVMDWSLVPFADRQAYLELGIRLCRAMTEQPAPVRSSESLFRLATDLAKAQWPIGDKVIGMITPQAPWGDSK